MPRSDIELGNPINPTTVHVVPRTLIPTPDQRIRVFISSTLVELADERQAAIEAVQQLRQTPIYFEEGARPNPPSRVYQDYLAQSDVFVGIYWQSYGSLGSGTTISGIEDEFRRSDSLPRLIYIKDPAPNRDPRLQEMLDGIRSDGLVSYKKFSSTEEFCLSVLNDLGHLFAEPFRGTQAMTSMPSPRGLPSVATPLVGRSRILAELVTVLQDPDVRLVTLIGPGGIGKTRVALSVANDASNMGFDGVSFVDLATVSDPDIVPSAIATVLGVPAPQVSLAEDLLADYFRGRSYLLILDNFEHLLLAAPFVSRLLTETSRIKVLVTSRAPLRVSSEHEFAIEPMDLEEAVTLFEDRAKARLPSFILTDEVRTSIEELCLRLEGIPLGIELAAARIKVLTPQAMLSEGDNRLDLQNPYRDAVARHRSLRDTIEWSHALLTPAEQSLFRLLSIFEGSFSVGAAEQIWKPSSDQSTDTVTLTTIESLIDASLLRRVTESGDESRFSMLDTIREYALEQLETAHEKNKAEQAFVQYYKDFTFQLAKKNKGVPSTDWMDYLEIERPNIMSALPLAREAEDQDSLVRIVWNIWRFWNVRGYLVEGKAWLDRAVAAASEVDSFIRTDLLVGAAIFASRRRDFDESRTLLLQVRDEHRLQGESEMEIQTLLQLASLESSQGTFGQSDLYLAEAEELSRKSDYALGILQAQAGRGGLAVNRQDFEGARVLLEPVCRQLRKLGRTGDEASLASCLKNLGQAQQAAGEWDAAISSTEESLRMMQALGDTRGRADSLVSLARMVQVQGDIGRARALREESVHLSSQIGDRLSAAFAMLEQGRYDPSRPVDERNLLLSQALKEFYELGDRRGIAETLEALARNRITHDPEFAVKLYAVADRLRTLIQFPLWGEYDIQQQEERIGFLRAILGQQRYSELWEEGRAESLDVMVESV